VSEELLRPSRSLFELLVFLPSNRFRPPSSITTESKLGKLPNTGNDSNRLAAASDNRG